MITNLYHPGDRCRTPVCYRCIVIRGSMIQNNYLDNLKNFLKKVVFLSKGVFKNSNQAHFLRQERERNMGRVGRCFSMV